MRTYAPLLSTVRLFSRSLWIGVVLLTLNAFPGTVQATTLPPLFNESLVAEGLSSPTLMAFAPDGRLFVAEQAGTLRIIENDVLLPDPFASIDVHSGGEHGLLGVAFHPNFATNHYIYVYYTTESQPHHNRISRFTADGNTVVPGSEVILVELENITAPNHNGGALNFGPDGKLYVGVGDYTIPENAQSFNNRQGKILRYNPNGTIPTNNPFYTVASGVNRSIWAYGLRNPFNFTFQPGTGRMFINDVGSDLIEEINEGVAGSNYGWPEFSGPTTEPGFRNPIYYYDHSIGCAITGGAFYNPPAAQFPAEYVGAYFFSDYCGNWIRRLDPVTREVDDFASSTTQYPVDIKISVDGVLYYLARGSGSTTGAVYRIDYGQQEPPVITQHPTSQTAALGEPATFICRADGSPLIRYQWQRGSSNIPGATASSYRLTATALADHNATFRCVARNSQGSATSNSAVLTVIDGERPVPTINTPATGTTYQAGQQISFSGSATDADQGTLPAPAFTWEVVQHHDDHTHPVLAPQSGVTSGSFTPSISSHETVNIWFRIRLTVTDSTGLTRTVHRDVHPQVARLSLLSNPSGLQVKYNGHPHITPYTVNEVVGVNVQIEALSPQVRGTTRWDFESWSAGGAASHTIIVPAGTPSYTAAFFGCPVTPNPSPGSASPTRNFYTTQTPVLTWNRVAWAAGYEIQVDNAANFSNPEYKNDQLTADTLAVEIEVPRDCTYYWRVRAKRPGGGWGNWSKPGIIVVDAP